MNIKNVECWYSNLFCVPSIVLSANMTRSFALEQTMDTMVHILFEVKFGF